MEKLHLNTPVFKQKTGNISFHFKMDCYQPTHSFKIRGIGHLLQHYKNNGYEDIVASSGGNAGCAVAYAAQKLDLRACVVVPETTPVYMQNRLKVLGAEVIVKGAVWDEAHQYALQLQQEKNAAYAHPFEHPVIWEGHASLVKECAGQMSEPDAIIVAVGGGGLLCGVLEGAEKVGWKRSKIIAAETKGAASFAASLKTGKLQTLPEIASIASSLGAKTITPKLIEWMQKRQLYSHVVSDRQAVDGCLWFLDEYKTLVEPACGTALSVIQQLPADLEDCRTVLVVVCGGAGTNLDTLQRYSQLEYEL